MYDGKLGIHVPAHFDLPGKNKLFSAWKLWFNIILLIAVLMQSDKQSLHLSDHSLISQWTVNIRNYERSLIIN